MSKGLQHEELIKLFDFLHTIASSQRQTNELLKRIADLQESFQSTLAHFLELDVRTRREEALRIQEQAKKGLPTKSDLLY